MGAKVVMARKVDTAATVKLLAGRPCLDFVNTVDWRTSEAPVELLATYGDLLAWGRHAGLLASKEAAAPEGPPLDRALWAIAWSAAGLLTDGEVGRVKQCAGPGCGWVFFDESGRRRWCAMEDCGNRAKARRHYARAKAADG